MLYLNVFCNTSDVMYNNLEKVERNQEKIANSFVNS